MNLLIEKVGFALIVKRKISEISIVITLNNTNSQLFSTKEKEGC